MLYSIQSRERTWKQNYPTRCHDAAFEKMLDPIAGIPATKNSRVGIFFVDDLFGTSGTEIEQRVLARLRKYFHGGAEDWNDVTFTRQRICWMKDPQSGSCIDVCQEKAIDELEVIPAERNTKEEPHWTPAIHTEYRSLLGQITLVSKQDTVSMLLQVFHMCFKGSFPTIGDVKALNKLARQLKSQSSETSVVVTHKTVEDIWIP